MVERFVRYNHIYFPEDDLISDLKTNGPYSCFEAYDRVAADVREILSVLTEEGIVKKFHGQFIKRYERPRGRIVAIYDWPNDCSVIAVLIIIVCLFGFSALLIFALLCIAVLRF